MIALKKLLAAIFSALFFSFASSAQFFSHESDPGSLKWSSFKTQHYKLIYPSGLDSLAIQYARSLEYYHFPVAASSSFIPGEQYKRKLPVIIHPYVAQTNGSVSWAPMKMDILNVPNAYKPEPKPLINSISVHELRHASQMQISNAGVLRGFGYILGEMISGFPSAIYYDDYMMEGDAVIAETALSNTGRGRYADFLDYYRMAFDNGDWRNHLAWMLGSYRRYTPNQYSYGYMVLSGLRVFYDQSTFAGDFARDAVRNPFRFSAFRSRAKKVTGLGFKSAIDEINRRHQAIWAEDMRLRGPFANAEQISKGNNWHIEYNNLTKLEDGGIIATRSGMREVNSLVRIEPDGSESFIRPFSYYAGGLTAGSTRLYWSEGVPHERWELQMSSRIRYMEDGKIRDLTKKGRLFNPSLSGSEDRLLATEYPIKGGSELLILSTSDGHELSRFPAPDSLQLFEGVFVGDRIFASATSKSGMGIYELRSGIFEPVLAPQPIVIKNLYSREGKICFTSDLNSVNESYSLDPDSGNCLQLSSSPYGNLAADGDWSVYSAWTPQGRMIFKVHDDVNLPADFSKPAPRPVADALSEQEVKLGAWEKENEFSAGEVKPYRKLLNIPNIHSWAPLFVNTDLIAQRSFDKINNLAGLGATVMYQNHLGTAYGSAAYTYDPSTVGDYRHGAHFDLTYAGLYPVFELNMDLEHNYAVEYCRLGVIGKDGTQEMQMNRSYLYKPEFNLSLDTYIPFNFSSGGWFRGFVPKVSWSLSNTRFNKSIYIGEFVENEEGVETFKVKDVKKDKTMLMQDIGLSLRGYVMQHTAKAAAFPRLGIGGELGYCARVDLRDVFSASAYAYLYGYLPGFVPQQGLKLTATHQHLFVGQGIISENRISTRPRGYNSAELNFFLADNAEKQTKVTLDYSIPFSFGNLAFLNPLLYIKSFEIMPHFDLLMTDGLKKGSLYSLGAEFTIHSGRLLFLKYDTEIGVSAGINGGSLFSCTPLKKTYAQFVFNINI